MCSLLLGSVGCFEGTPAAPERDDAANAARTGNLLSHFEAGESLETACGVVAGVEMGIEGPGQASDQCTAPFLTFDVEDEFSDFDNVADCFFVVKPGMWSVDSLDAIDANGDVLSCCTAVLPPPVRVDVFETSEVVAAITCDVDQNGGLDIVVTINVEPVIVGLEYTPSKFGSTCAPILLHAEAQDADGGPINYLWTVTSSPPGADYALVASVDNASFAAKTTGDYELKVMATDDRGASTHLYFPIHIVEAVELDCDLAEVCETNLP